MATINRRLGKYQAQVRKAGYKTRSKTFTNLKDARSWAKSLEVEIERGEFVDRSRHTLSDAIERYRNDPSRNLSTNQNTMLDWWDAELGRCYVTTLRRSMFIEARDKLRKINSPRGVKIKPATVNRRVMAISAVLTEAMDWEWINNNPARLKQLPENNKRGDDVVLLQDKQWQLLLERARASWQPDLYPFIVCAVVSGARAGELRNLRWRDIDLDKGIAKLLVTKNGTTRAIPLQGHALDLLREKKATRDLPQLNESDFVFLNRTGSHFNYRPCWNRARVEAGLAHFRFHDLRHLAASHMAMAGGGRSEVGKILGHSSAQMVERYTHHFDDHVADLGKLVAARLFQE